MGKDPKNDLFHSSRQSSNSATGCDVINRWIIGTRNFAKSWAPPCIVVTFRDGPLENLSEGGGRAKYNKNIRTRKNEKMKKKIMRANKP